MGPKWLSLGSLELAAALLRALYEAKNQEHCACGRQHLRKRWRLIAWTRSLRR
jgi:hypothetical protein